MIPRSEATQSIAAAKAPAGLGPGYEALCDPERFSDVLARFAASLTAERLDLAEINRFLGRRSIGGLLLLLALPMALPIPAPGVAVIFGLPLILVSFQLLWGQRHAWLPVRLARRSIARTDFIALVARTLPALRGIERIMRPRLSWLAGDWMVPPIGATCLVLAIIITLPIPFGHMLPGAAISVLALGMIEHDGLAIAAGLIAACLGLAVVAAALFGLAAGLRISLGI